MKPTCYLPLLVPLGLLIATLLYLNPPLVALAQDPLSQTGTSFIENIGQFDETIRFQTLGGPNILRVTNDGLWFSFFKITEPKQLVGVTIKLTFMQTNPQVDLIPFNQTKTVINYYQGRSAQTWFTQVPVWQGVIYRNLYPNVDLKISPQQGQLVMRFIPRVARDIRGGRAFLSAQRENLNSIDVKDIEAGIPPLLPQREELIGFAARNSVYAPFGGSAGLFPITLRVEGGDILSTTANSLYLQTALGPVKIPLPLSPVAWQLEGYQNGQQKIMHTIPASNQAAYQTNQTHSPHIVHRPLTETNLIYSTYLGGSLWDEAEAIIAAEAGQFILAGHTQSVTFPTTTGRFALAHNVDAFIAKLDSEQDANPLGSTEWVYLTLFLGDVEEYITDIALDSQGTVYASGHTDSSNFPTSEGAFQRQIQGGFDAFALSIDAAGQLVYATLLGGRDLEQGTAIAVDETGRAYLSGGTWSNDFPITAAAYQNTNRGQRDVFITRLNAEGSALSYSTFWGGSSQEQAEGLALRGEDMVYLTGWSRSDDLPTTTKAIGPTYQDNFDAFVLKFDLNQSETIYATYLGGSGEERGFAIAVDEVGQAVVSGRTTSIDYPVTATTFDIKHGGGICDFALCPDAFLTKLSSQGTKLMYSTYLGGSDWDDGRGLALDKRGWAYLTGETHSVDLPITDLAYDRQLDGEQDAFIIQFDEANETLVYASYLGGSDWESGNCIALDGNLVRVYIAGKTRSSDFPITTNAYHKALSGDYDAFGLGLRLPTINQFKRYLPLIQSP